VVPVRVHCVRGASGPTVQSTGQPTRCAVGFPPCCALRLPVTKTLELPLMKKLLVFATIAFSAIAAAAGPISTYDTGTFVILGKDRAPTNMFYRLSQNKNNWRMEGKEPGGTWKDISCDRGCGYKATSPAEAASYLPAAMSEKYDIVCIKNVAQAFCRYTLTSEPKQGGYVVVALVTGRPTPILVQRVAAK
jgi:hypothetical protein